MTVHTKVIHEEHIGERIDKIITVYDELISRSKAQQLIKKGAILINDRRVKPNYRCEQGDVLSWFIPKKPERMIEAEDIPLDIVYEDNHLIVINKKQGMVVHPTDHQHTGTLVNALLYYTSSLAQMGTERPGIVHRLDKDTSGLLIVAKTDETFERLSDSFKHRRIRRVYEALVHGKIEHEQGIIEAPIGRHPKRRLQMAVQSDGRFAKTSFRVITSTNSYTHVTCQLETGRTHQIRVHMEYIGHPIVNDPVYGTNQDQGTTGQMLFAKQIVFQHPITNEPMAFTIDAPPYFEKEKKLLGIE